MRELLSRRQLLMDTAAGLSALALGGSVRAQSVPRARPLPPDLHIVDAPEAIEVKARPLPSFDLRDRSRVRFGSLEYRSGLVLTSSFPDFGGLSALRLDAKGERFIS